MPLTARIAGLLLLFLFVTGNLSNAYLIQGGDNHAPGELDQVVSERKATQTMSESKMVSADYNFMMKVEKKKEIGGRAKYTRKSRMLMSRESYRARFVAFNADYKGPRHHPPKNN